MDALRSFALLPATAPLHSREIEIPLGDDPISVEHVGMIRHSRVWYASGRFCPSTYGTRGTSTVPSMMALIALMDRLGGGDVKPGQIWRHDTCDPTERIFTYEIDRIEGERIFLVPLNGGPMAETNVGSLLAYWAPVSL